MNLERLLSYLVCPRCHGPLRADDGGEWLVCEADRLAYPLVDGIACLTAASARSLETGPPAGGPAG